MAKFKVGDVLENTAFGGYEKVITAVGRRNYLYEYTDKAAHGSSETAEQIYILDTNNRKVEPKWEVGKTYRRASAGGGSRFVVEFVNRDGDAMIRWLEGVNIWGVMGLCLSAKSRPTYEEVADD